MRLSIIVLVTLFGAMVMAAEGTDLVQRVEYQRHDLRVTSLCIEGHVVVVAHSDVGKGGGLQMLQLQHEVNGNIVPMQCNPNKDSK